MSKHCINFWIGDGYCDDSCNNIIDSFDGGDCCPPFKTFGLVTFFFFFFQWGAVVQWVYSSIFSLPRQGSRDRIPVFLFLLFGQKTSLSRSLSPLSSLQSLSRLFGCTMHDAREGKEDRKDQYLH